MAEYTNPLESFAKGYAAIGAVQEDMASKDILKQAYASATPDQAKDPQAQQNIYNQAAIMAGKQGQASLAYSFQKQAKELDGAAQTKQLNEYKVKGAQMEYMGQLLAGASSEEDLKNISNTIVTDPNGKMIVEGVLRGPGTFEEKKKRLEDMSMTVKEHLDAQRLAVEAAYKQKQIENIDTDNIRAQKDQALRQQKEERLEKEAKTREERAEARESRAERREARLESKGDQIKLSPSEVARSQRGINATGNIASSLETLSNFSSGVTTGFLPDLVSQKGMINAVKSSAIRGLSKDEANEMNTTFTGIGRSLAAVESGGLATGLAELSKKMEQGLYIRPGDSPKTVAFKLADIRRITEESLQPAIDSGMLTNKQQETADKLINRIKKAVPYTVKDVQEATRKAGAKTIGEKSVEITKPKGTGTKEDPIKLD